MLELQIYENDEFGSIRTMKINGDPWFMGKDVAGILGYANSAKAIRDHVYEEDKLTERIVLSGQNREVIFINESGLYALILSSKLPTARKFKKWVTGEVIPSIRKYGLYASKDNLEQLSCNPQLVIEIAKALVKEEEKNEKLSSQIADSKPKAEYFDTFISPEGCTNLRITALELGIPEKEFISFLIEHRYLYRSHSGKLLPYAEYIKRGYFEIRDFYQCDRSLDHYTLVTCKGKNHFFRLFSNIEREE